MIWHVFYVVFWENKSSLVTFVSDIKCLLMQSGCSQYYVAICAIIESYDSSKWAILLTWPIKLDTSLIKISNCLLCKNTPNNSLNILRWWWKQPATPLTNYHSVFLVKCCRVISGFSPQHMIYVSTITLPCFAAQQCVDHQNNSCASLETFALMRPLTNRASARGRKSTGATAHCLLILSIGSLHINRCRSDRAAHFENEKVDLKFVIWKYTGYSKVKMLLVETAFSLREVKLFHWASECDTL